MLVYLQRHLSTIHIFSMITPAREPLARGIRVRVPDNCSGRHSFGVNVVDVVVSVGGTKHGFSPSLNYP